MKKIVILMAVFSLAGFGFILPALAEENSSSQPRQVVVYGDLSSIGGQAGDGRLILKVSRVSPQNVRNFSGVYPVKDAFLSVQVTERTKIVRKFMGKADFSELAVGDKLMINGKLGEDGAVTAQLVKDESIHAAFYAKVGEVISIDSEAKTFVTKNGNREFKIFVTPNTKFAKVGMENPTFADLAVGSGVRVRGVIRQAAHEVTADSVVIAPGKTELEAKKLENRKELAEKKKQTLLKQLEKRKEQLEKQIEKLKNALEKVQKEMEDVNKN